MSQSHRLLGEGIPGPHGLGGAPFAADARKARAWIAALPRANATGTQLNLAQALDSLAAQKLDGSQRLSVLEELRPAIGESIGLLKRDYAGSALPLAPAKANAAQQVEGFHLALAAAYRLAAFELCAPSGNIPMLRGGTVATALARATWHYAQALATVWRVYRAPATGVWQGLHRLHAFAVENRLDARPVDDELAGSPVEVRVQYLQALLMAITHPLAFSQQEQDLLWRATREFAPRCNVANHPPRDNAPVVPGDTDHGPGPGVIGETPTQWLDMAAFECEVDAALERQRDGQSDLMPPRGPGLRVGVELLERLRRSFGLSAARTRVRLPGGHTLRTVFGLSGLHFYLAGQRDFEAFMRQAAQHVVHIVDRASWAGAATDASKVPVHEARVLDQSLGGYRMAWSQASQIRARVGELVGLTFADADEYPEWMLGVIRWLRYEADGGLSAGVELISRYTGAVGLRTTEGEDPIRAVEMRSMDGDERQFLAHNSLDSAATRILVVRDQPADAPETEVEEILAGVDVLLNAGDYALLRPLRADLVAESDEGVA
jgi:cyclic-di-GMP-binding protein